MPGKNIRDLGGKPLIAYSIQVALACAAVDRVVVSTDDESIAAVARQYGAETPFLRPAELAGDTSSELDAWKHAIRQTEKLTGEKISVFLSLPPTAPMRSLNDVERCLHEYSTGAFDIVVTIKEAARSPWFNMLKQDSRGYYELVNADTEGTGIVRRQDAPTVYDLTTVAYVADRDYVLGTDSVLAGRVGAVLIPQERAIDIDTMHDFEMAEWQLRCTSSDEINS